MISHQDVGVDTTGVAAGRGGQAISEECVIRGRDEQNRAVVAALDHVLRQPDY
jgi:hypothetical protein